MKKKKLKKKLRNARNNLHYFQFFSETQEEVMANLVEKLHVNGVKVIFQENRIETTTCSDDERHFISGPTGLSSIELDFSDYNTKFMDAMKETLGAHTTLL